MRQKFLKAGTYLRTFTNYDMFRIIRMMPYSNKGKAWRFLRYT